ncbi:pentatricopeptide repeat-containing protein At4g13650-like [Typha angustifolia]|uniref:pentatricopeptide repeat-containing protein At4g13650-like n=1 Tax=Typha angustifolia TaxID=59011 RepID=UPI003C2ACE9B
MYYQFTRTTCSHGKTQKIYSLIRLTLHNHLCLASTCTTSDYSHKSHHVLNPISNLNLRKDPLTIANALSFSSLSNLPHLGTQIHAQIIKLGFSNDVFSQNNLIVMYSKCGPLDHALRVFGEMPERNVVSWTSMISGLIRNGEHEIGFQLLVDMTRSGFRPNEFTFASVMSVCSLIEAMKFGSSLHSNALKVGLDQNAYVGSSLVLMYARFGNIEAAELAFECIVYRDLACWNSMVEGYVLTGYGYDAMKTVAFMHQEQLGTDQFSYISAIKGCLITGDFNYGRQIHCLIVQNKFQSNNAVMNSLADLYFRFHMKNSAMKVFGKIQEKDVVSWNTVISRSAQEEDEREVVGLFSDMLLNGLKPNQVTLSVILRMCAAKEHISLGLQFFGFAYRSGFSDNVLVVNSIINMLTRCGLVESAYILFSGISARNPVTWNEMIAGYGINGYSEEALQLFCNLIRMGLRADEFTYSGVLSTCNEIQDPRIYEQIHANILKFGFSSYLFVWTSLINGYAVFGLVKSSFKIFEEIEESDLVSWGAIISAFSKQGLIIEAFSLLKCLQEAGEKPDEFILASVLNASANVSVINHCKCIHSHVMKAGYERHFCVSSAVIDAYAKCGDITSSKKAFDTIPVDQDAILYNTMITAFAHHGLIMEALGLYEKMKQANLSPTQATFLALLLACNHLGLVEQGKYLFNSAKSTYGMHPAKDNFACLIDLLARKGLLEEARDIIRSMPYEPWPAVWRSLLNGCRIHGNKEMGEFAAEEILKLTPNSDAAYMLLSNIYAEDGRWEYAEETRMRMEEKGVHKVLGYSMIEI